MSDILAALMAQARAIDAATEAAAAQTGTQQPPAPTLPADAQAAQPAPGGQGESLEALEARLRSDWADRRRNAGFEADRERNEAILREALAQRGVREFKPDGASSADLPRNLRLDGSEWSAADVRLANDLQRFLPTVDLLGGGRFPPGYRR